jgi:hypothetical protein
MVAVGSSSTPSQPTEDIRYKTTVSSTHDKSPPVKYLPFCSVLVRSVEHIWICKPPVIRHVPLTFDGLRYLIGQKWQVFWLFITVYNLNNYI